MTETEKNEQMRLVLYRGQDIMATIDLNPVVDPRWAKNALPAALQSIASTPVPSVSPEPERPSVATETPVVTKTDPHATEAPETAETPDKPHTVDTFEEIVLGILTDGPEHFNSLRTKVVGKVQTISGEAEELPMKECYGLLSRMVKRGQISFSLGQYRRVEP